MRTYTPSFMSLNRFLITANSGHLSKQFSGPVNFEINVKYAPIVLQTANNAKSSVCQLANDHLASTPIIISPEIC